MTVYVITHEVTNEVVGVFNTENENDILAGMLIYLYNHNFHNENPEIVSEFVALWVERGIECLDTFDFNYVVKILNEPSSFEDF